MKALNKKLLRDLWRIKGQCLAIVLVIACGVATFVMSLSTLSSLKSNLDDYYEQYKFADIFLHVTRVPMSYAMQVKKIPGVLAIQTRIVEQATLSVRGQNEPSVGRFISFKNNSELNLLHLRLGRLLNPLQTNEIIASEGFFNAHKLKLGDSITAVINGHQKSFKIVGVAITPEYIYAIRPGDILPDEKHFGIFWMNEEELAAAYNMEGAFNDLTIKIIPHASIPALIAALDRLFEPYGNLGAYSREEQTSHKFISNEMRELRAMAIIAPLIFLIVSSFLLNIVLSRLIRIEREQIATLKAFGYRRNEIAWHYIKFLLILTCLGVVLGTAFGARLGQGLTQMYAHFFHFPLIQFRLDYSSVFFAFTLATGSALLAAAHTIRAIALLPPAESMRPEVPPSFRRFQSLNSTLIARLPVVAKMIIRQITLHPVRTLLSSIGIALSTAVVIIGNSAKDALDWVLYNQFEIAQHYDMSITFNNPTESSVLYDIQRLPGVLLAEPFRSAAVEISSGNLKRRIGISGLIENSRLNRLVDINGFHKFLPYSGLLISSKLAQVLNLNNGDIVNLKLLEEKQQQVKLKVSDTIDDFAGSSAYLSIASMNDLLNERELISGAFLAVNPQYLNELYTTLKTLPQVQSLAVKNLMKKNFEDTIAENLLRMRFYNILFACIIACGVIYNIVRIALSERSRDLATLRVLGFSSREVAAILLGELTLIVIISLPLGCLFGYFLTRITALAYDTELFRIPVVIASNTYGYAMMVTVLASITSGLLVRKSVYQLNMISVLKSRD